jgi:hypothetical protein
VTARTLGLAALTSTAVMRCGSSPARSNGADPQLGAGGDGGAHEPLLVMILWTLKSF